MNSLAGIITAYLLGTIPFGLIIGRLVKGVDVRKHGSGNLGASNVFRVVGKGWGLLVLALDVSKGYGAVRMAGFFSGGMQEWFLIALAMAAILGHTFPVWLRFKGGKGVATSLGVFLAAAMVPTLITFGLWMIIAAISRMISVASMGAALLFPFVIVLTVRETGIFPYLFGVSLILSIFIFFTHRSNIGRIIRGEESKFY